MEIKLSKLLNMIKSIQFVLIRVKNYWIFMSTFVGRPQVITSTDTVLQCWHAKIDIVQWNLILINFENPFLIQWSDSLSRFVCTLGIFWRYQMFLLGYWFSITLASDIYEEILIFEMLFWCSKIGSINVIVTVLKCELGWVQSFQMLTSGRYRLVLYWLIWTLERHGHNRYMHDKRWSQQYKKMENQNQPCPFVFSPCTYSKHLYVSWVNKFFFHI